MLALEARVNHWCLPRLLDLDDSPLVARKKSGSWAAALQKEKAAAQLPLFSSGRIST